MRSLQSEQITIQFPNKEPLPSPNFGIHLQKVLNTLENLAANSQNMWFLYCIVGQERLRIGAFGIVS